MDKLISLIKRRERLKRQYEKYSKLRKENFLKNIPGSALESDVVAWDAFMLQIRDELLAVDLEIARYMFDLER